MSLLATPTFAGVAETETFYVRQGAPQVAGVASVQGVSGAVGITSSDSSITVAVAGQNVNLTTTGNALAPSTVSASGAITSATTITATGAVSGASFSNSTPGVVAFTTPNYGATPPVDATQIMDGNLHSASATTFSVSALSNYKSLKVAFTGGSIYNNSAGGGTWTATLYLCSIAAVPAVGAALNPNVLVPISLPSQYTQLTGNVGGSLSLNVVPGASFNQQQLMSVVIPYPSTGTLTIWDYCTSGATRTWVNDLTITVSGIL
jgi:hypothetical protein